MYAYIFYKSPVSFVSNTQKGNTALHCAVCSGHLTTTKLLLDARSNVNIANEV